MASLVLLFPVLSQAASYKYIRIGEKADAQSTPAPGIAMMGGGKDLDEAFRWLCQKANGGDLVVLRARGGGDYNSYIKGLCPLNSVATLVIPTREAANNPAVAEIIRHAEAVFITGGDQSRYVNFWQGTPVEDAINAGIAAGKPLGGTSAGLAVQGEFVYGAMKDKPHDKDLASTDVLPNPYVDRVTLVRNFLRVPLLTNTLTDSHFAKRDRMGRTLGFLARLMADGWSRDPREIAIDERSAVLVETDGQAKIVGPGLGAYFLKPQKAPDACKAGVPLTFRNITVHKAPTGSRFNIVSWTGEGGSNYMLSVESGVIHSTQSGNVIY